MYFKQNFKYLKLRKNVSIQDIEEATGLSSVGNYPNGRALPQIPALIKLAEYFDVSIDDLLLKDMALMSGVEDEPVDYVSKRFDDLEEKIMTLKKEIDDFKKR
jgi:transcriptional regulator with XRE-family HTH domain